MSKSRFDKEELYLNRQDEDKLLLFTTGIVFSTGLTATLMGIFWYGFLAALGVIATLYIVDKRQK